MKYHWIVRLFRRAPIRLTAFVIMIVSILCFWIPIVIAALDVAHEFAESAKHEYGRLWSAFRTACRALVTGKRQERSI